MTIDPDEVVERDDLAPTERLHIIADFWPKASAVSAPTHAAWAESAASRKRGRWT
jgi:hypothetical protein